MKPSGTTSKNRLSEQENAALAAFKKGLLDKFDRGFLELRLYGSRARGEGHEGSDLDIAVLVQTETGAARKEIYNAAAGIYMEYGINISPLVISKKRFEWLRSIKRGIALDISNEGIRV